MPVGKANAQIGATVRFNDIKGDRILSASHEKNNYFVTCSHTDDDRSCFLVENMTTGTKKKFYTTEHVEPAMFYTCSGYIVNDMKIDGFDCWFCGTKWVRTGQYVYTIEGLLVPETLYCAYIGRFSLHDAINGGGDFEIMEIINSGKLEHFTLAKDGGIYATAGMFIYKIYPAVNGYSVDIGRIVHPGAGGRFMDVVCAGDTVITLSVCADSTHYFHYHDMFYLNYGTRANFISANTTNRYDTYYAYNDRRARRHSGAPIYLSKTYNGCGVVVSYITENTDFPPYDFPWKLIMFHVPREHAVPSEIIHNSDTATYSKIKDIKSSDTLHGKSFITVLLEDFYGNSIIRLPRIGTGQPVIFDTIRKVKFPSLENISPFRNPGDILRLPSIYVAGHYPLFQNRVARNIKYNVRNENTRVDKIPWGCYDNSYGYWDIDTCMYNVYDADDYTIIPHTNTQAAFENHPFESVDAPFTTICLDPDSDN